MPAPRPCAGPHPCKFFQKGATPKAPAKAGDPVENIGRAKYSLCRREGALETAYEERATGECGPEGKLRA